MINDETIYWQQGFAAGRASKHGDAGLVRANREWLSRALAVESKADGKIAEAAYKRGYSEAARVGNLDHEQRTYVQGAFRAEIESIAPLLTSLGEDSRP